MVGIRRADRIICRTPTLGKSGSTRIAKWKFDCIRKAILDGLGEGKIAFSELTDNVSNRLSQEERDALGSLGWYVTTVKLELEVRGEINRLPQKGKQILELAEKN